MLPRARTCVLLAQDRVLDLDAPDPWAWTDRDLADRLARVSRWAGSSAWPRPLSVAQHSLLVLRLRDRRGPAPSANERLTALLHDAEEGFLGFDPITPLKAKLGREFADLCAVLKSAIAERYGLQPLTEGDCALLKEADRVAASLEALHVVGWSAHQIRSILNLPLSDLSADPLFDGAAEEDGYEPWEPWDAARASAEFLSALQLLRTPGPLADQRHVRA